MSRCTNHGKRTTSTAVGRLIIHCCTACDVVVATTTKPVAVHAKTR